MADYSFTAVIEPDDDSFHAYVPALPGCHTFGDTIDEARANLIEAVELHIACLIEDGIEVPHEAGEPIVEKLHVLLPA
ncbi:MAG: hypothetical protein C0506_10975 [Anaerolinea sp.]|nr:hypothetical protein [Anaerolinea sp.]